MTSFTDYTEKNTFQNGVAQQYRVMKYFKDIVNNFFADPRNIHDTRLKSLLYDASGDLRKDCFRSGTPFQQDGTYSGATPAVIVSLGDIRYETKPITGGFNSDFNMNPAQPIRAQYRLKHIPLTITVITQSYDGTVLLTELIETFLVMNSSVIQSDVNMLSYVGVTGATAPQAVKPGAAGNAKQVYSSQIGLDTLSVLTWTQDTQGPVFRGISIKTNM